MKTSAFGEEIIIDYMTLLLDQLKVNFGFVDIHEQRVKREQGERRVLNYLLKDIPKTFGIVNPRTNKSEKLDIIFYNQRLKSVKHKTIEPDMIDTDWP